MISKKDVSKLESLIYLLAVSQNKSKRKVSEELGTSVDTLNKYISDLEQELGIKLLASNGRGSVTTPDAKKIIKLAKELKQIIKTLDSYAQKKVDIAGTVRFGMTEGINACMFPENVIDFYDQYPDLNLDVAVYDSTPNLNIFEADVAATFQIPQGNDLVILSSKEIKCSLYASSKYISRFGMPENLDDLLENHRMCVKSGHPIYIPGWKDIIRKAKKICLTTNTTFSLIAQIDNGGGIGLIPDISARKNFVRIHTAGFEPVVNFHLVAHKDTKDIPKVRVLIEYLQEILNGL